jgi:hypothetical protein
MSIVSLYLPILVSAALVWIASALVWMVFPWHKKDHSRTPDEEAVRAALKAAPPGLYSLPHCADHKAFKEPELRKKFEEGPIAMITIMPSGMPTMGGKLLGSFIYYVVVGILCAYLLTRTAATNGTYLDIFRVTGTVAFIAYGVAYVQDSVWFGRPWSLTLKSSLDALIYAALTAGVFGWLVVS